MKDSTISRQAAINCITYDEEYMFERLKALPPVTPQPNIGRWIPVSERLPDIHDYCRKYLVTDCHRNIYTSLFTESSEKSWWSHDNVIAWMPLPKPYKAESEVEE